MEDIDRELHRLAVDDPYGSSRGTHHYPSPNAARSHTASQPLLSPQHPHTRTCPRALPPAAPPTPRGWQSPCQTLQGTLHAPCSPAPCSLQPAPAPLQAHLDDAAAADDLGDRPEHSQHRSRRQLRRLPGASRLDPRPCHPTRPATGTAGLPLDPHPSTPAPATHPALPCHLVT